MDTAIPKTKIPKLTQPNLNMLRNQLDYSRVPFSDRGSRFNDFQGNREKPILYQIGRKTDER